MAKIAKITLILLSCIPLAHADYHYASHEGSNEYPYTSWETAADSIQLAVDAAEPGDTVYIGVGDWHETIGMQEWDSLMALIGMGMDSTRIWWDVSGRAVIYNATNTLLKDIYFDHTARWVCVYSLQDRNLTALNCRFSGGEIAAWRGQIIVSNCIFNDIYHGIYLGWGGQLIVNNCLFNESQYTCIETENSTNIIQNNIFINMQFNAITFSYYPESSLVENNVVYNTEPWQLGSISYGGIDYSVTRNNTLYLNQTWQYDEAFIYNTNNAQYINNAVAKAYTGFYELTEQVDTVVIKYNNLWQNVRNYRMFDDIVDSVGNIYQDPMFMGDWDFHLQAYSPLIDAGDPDILDVDGTRSDIGCYGGPGGCSYTYLDLAPRIPDSITVEADSDLIILSWPMNTEADFNRYQIFRDSASGFEPTIFNKIAEPETSYYEDNDIDAETAYYYRLTSVDNQGNISDFSDEVAVIPTYAPSFPDDGLPKYTVIECAYPNPANSNVTIVYSASNLGPQPPQVELKIYDIQGRVVKTLVEDRIPMGTYRVVWDGTNDNGEPVASGTYIAKVSQWGMDAGDFPVKITLLK